jgi:hypothetical protein
MRTHRSSTILDVCHLRSFAVAPSKVRAALGGHPGGVEARPATGSLCCKGSDGRRGGVLQHFPFGIEVVAPAPLRPARVIIVVFKVCCHQTGCSRPSLNCTRRGGYWERESARAHTRCTATANERARGTKTAAAVAAQPETTEEGKKKRGWNERVSMQK